MSHAELICGFFLIKDSLIHVGAKFSPCMRQDRNIDKAILSDKAKENQTACCIYNDGSGCVQSSAANCSVSISLASVVI